MSNVINKLKGILDMPLNEFFNVPIPTINCHVCELPEKIYYWFRGEDNCKVGACEECFHELPMCVNCESRSLYVGEHGICHQCVHDSAVMDINRWQYSIESITIESRTPR